MNAQTYQKDWKKIDSLLAEGLPETALKETEILIQKIKADVSNKYQVPLLVKATIYFNNFKSDLEENGLINVIGRMETEIKNEKGNTRAILQSLLAQLYSQYLSRNIYKLKNQTTLEDNKSEDVSTWDIKKISDRIFELYAASISDPEIKKVNLADFKMILSIAFYEANLMPTLYDLLMKRAIDFFSADNSYLAQPAYRFYIEEDAALADAKTFVNHKFTAKDTLSGKFRCLQFYQDLLRFHLEDKKPAALADVNLRRLEWVHKNATISNKDELYLNTLNNLAKEFEANTIAGEALYLVANWHYTVGTTYQPSPEETYRWDIKKAKEICDQIVAKYPDTSFCVMQANYLIDKIAEKSFSFDLHEVTAPKKPILVSLQYKNLSKVHLKMIKVTEFELDMMNTLKYEKDKAIGYLKTLTAQKTWSVNLPNEGDFQEHQTEIAAPGLELGYYMLLISEKEDFSYKNNGIFYSTFNVSNLSYFNKKNDGIIEYYVTDISSGKPLKGVKLEFYNNVYNNFFRKYENIKIAEAISDEKGFVSSELLKNSKNNSFYVKFSMGKDELFEKGYFYNSRYDNEETPKDHTHFFLDRAIYRPGQTVYFKGIVLIGSGVKTRIVSAYETDVVFYDANHIEFARKKVTTNEYGTFEGSFTAPSTGLTGLMTITDIKNYSSVYFRVEEYKRPKFEVSFKEIEESFKVNDTVKIKGFAKAYAGSNIDGAKVQYRITRVVDFPYRRSWWWNPWTRPDQEISFGEIKTDEKGEFEISFNAIPDKSIPAGQNPHFTYKIEADVTDINGETRSKNTTVRVAYVALDLNISVAENIDKNVETVFKFNTQNMNGGFEAAKGTIKIEILESPKNSFSSRLWSEPDCFTLTKEEFKKAFPYFAYKGEDKIENYPVVKTVLQSDFDSKVSKELLLNDIKNWPQGPYKLTINTADKYGEKIEVLRYFTLYSTTENKLPGNEALFVAKRTIEAEPGDKVSFDYGSIEKDAYILVEVEHDRKLVSSEWVQPKGRNKIELNVEEKHRGNFFVHLTMVHNGRFNTKHATIPVPWSNKELKIEYSTFRDKLLPGQDEEWKVKITGLKKDKVAAELLAAMYDESLDVFAPNYWYLSVYPYNYPAMVPYSSFSFSQNSSSYLNTEKWNKPNSYPVNHVYTDINWFGLDYYNEGRLYMATRAVKSGKGRDSKYLPSPAFQSKEEEVNEFIMEEPTTERELNDSTAEKPDEINSDNGDFSDVKVRTNLNETVFFFPQLMTDENGDVILKFKMNEALTRWKFMWLAHTKDLKIGSGTNNVVTQKDLMVMPNAPRFFRQNDEIYFTAKVSNMTEKEMNGEAVLQLFDAVSMKAIDKDFDNTKAQIPFTAAGGQSAPLVWKIKIPDNWTNAVTYRVIAKSGTFSDGEENSLPVVSNRMLVTETMPLPIRGGQTKTFEFKRMADVSKSSSMRHHKYTLEFTPNPAWYAVQALPYIMEYPYDCTEQIFSRYYANSIASNVANSNPKIKKVFDSWKEAQPDALLSNLSKNQELKYALLEETPWVLDAQNEAQQKRDLGVLFDFNRMSNELSKARDKMTDRQLSNGGFSWFPGGRDSWYITQYIVEGLGHLKELKISKPMEDSKSTTMIFKALKYIDDRLADYYNELLKEARKSSMGEKAYLELDHLDYMAIHYLYARSFFQIVSVENKDCRKAIEYYENQAKKYWLKKSDYMQGLLALALHRKDLDKETPQKIVKSLKERALKSEEMGMYWQYPGGYFWYEMPIETHCLLIEVFDVVAQDKQAVEDLKTYLLKAKQTTHWKTTKATASACYVLLRTGDNWLMEDQEVKITLGKELLDQSKISKEAGTGYFKTSFEATQIKNDMSSVKVENPNKNVAWGAVYWQYFENYDKITDFKETPLKITKKLFREVKTDRGPVLESIENGTELAVGDLVKIRIELKVDRDMEYVHMKDHRSSGFEPVNVLSNYKYQGGLGYYENTRDVSTNFFFDYLSKGTYVFEYPLRVSHKGDFSNGVTTIQCMYAPEFTSHSEGVRVKVK